MNKKVAILGCGPAGLFSAWAAIQRNYDVHIFSKKRPSEMFGAQYLHKPIPGIEQTRTLLKYKLIGDASIYRKRVYGDRDYIDVSPAYLSNEHYAYDIRKAYHFLYHRLENRITDIGKIDGRMLRLAMRSDTWDYGMTINSIPLPSLCINQKCEFDSVSIRALGDAPERGRFSPIGVAEDTVLCNGEDGPGAPDWYRVSNVFGYNTVEYPVSGGPQEAAWVKKPIRNNCDCHRGVYRVGRYGSWTKGVLSHQAYEDTNGIIDDYERRG